MTINTVQELAKILGCNDSTEIPEKVKSIRECGIELILYYNNQTTLSSYDKCAERTVRSTNDIVKVPEYTWANPGNPETFAFWSEDYPLWLDSCQ